VRVRLLHLSDLHLRAVPGAGEVDADRSLRHVLDACAHLENIAALIVTGDIADDGSLAAYERAGHALRDYARSHDAYVMVCPGNHDDRDAFVGVLGSGHFDPDGNEVGTRGPNGRVCASTTVDGVRIITLDSLVPGKWYGHLGGEQLEWLACLLTEEPDVLTVLAMHHPPIDIGVYIQQRVRLHDRDQLASTLAAGSVAAVLCGHFHQQISGSLAGVPIWVTPGVLTRIDHLTGPAGTEHALTGGGATLIDLTSPLAPLFATITAADPAAGRHVYTVTQDEIADELAEFGRPG
jgi:3',5'-cyclic-AMP phosphodiesterase